MGLPANVVAAVAILRVHGTAKQAYDFGGVTYW